MFQFYACFSNALAFIIQYDTGCMNDPNENQEKSCILYSLYTSTINMDFLEFCKGNLPKGIKFRVETEIKI